MTYEVQTLVSGRFLALVNGEFLRNSNGARRTFKYQMEAERAAYIAEKKEREAKAS
jgi:hypothetical protein